MTIKLLQFLFRGYAGRAPKSVREALQVPRYGVHDRRRRKEFLPKYVKVVRNGHYLRVTVPPHKMSKGAGDSSTQVAKRATTAPAKASAEAVKPFDMPKPIVVPAVKISTAKKFLKWFRSNLPVLALNCGSVCILLGFSRSDILELRSLTMTGQLTFAAYNLAQPNILWPSVLWSTLFASVNATKIRNIFHERTAEVHMTEEQERIFVDYFMNHGVTPLQFMWVEGKATTKLFKKGETLIHKGDTIDRIFLVVKGSTHAHILGQRLTAASSGPKTRGDQLEGGDSGAWIGEMAFLDWFHRRHDNDDQTKNAARLGRGVSMYTIIVDEDCQVMEWSHEAMEELMEMSTDLRAALTRAITAAVVAKVVNLTIGDVDRPTESWISWLVDWNSKDGTRIQVERPQ